MNWRKAVRRSTAILIILTLSVLSGFVYNIVWTRIDRVRYPREYSEYVAEYSELYGVPEPIIYAVIKTESDFVSNAVSSAGAVGLMQITPDTFEWIAMLKKETIDVGMLYDPGTNIEYGTYLLSYLYMHYNRWDTVFAAYNAGMARVGEWLENPEYIGQNGELTVIPIAETEKYINKVNDAIEVYRRLYY